ncbi:hypothetical protein WAA20_14980 [Butyrivibrio fibrisolvens]|uniref:hypothetical protein n=1 Tax=Butyrivibrio fibrisolvens TaxID=831 RepID=UPI0014308263|nr:hypothetical protein [Butyrivibrio fibrisolvens]
MSRLKISELSLDDRDWADNQDELNALKKIIEENRSDIEENEEIPSELLDRFK